MAIEQRFVLTNASCAKTPLDIVRRTVVAARAMHDAAPRQNLASAENQRATKLGQ